MNSNRQALLETDQVRVYKDKSRGWVAIDIHTPNAPRPWREAATLNPDEWVALRDAIGETARQDMARDVLLTVSGE